MPHFVIEYSANLDAELDPALLMARLSDAAVATGIFPLAGIRLRCHRAADYRVADGHPDNAFLHVMVRIGHGRDLETRERAGQIIFAALCEHMAPIQARRPLALSMEIVELHPDLNFKTGNIREHMKRRETPPVAAS